MEKQHNRFTRASALQVTISFSLLSLITILLVVASPTTTKKDGLQLKVGTDDSIGIGTLPATEGIVGLRNQSREQLHRTLTFAERVAYQRAIEQVYWNHRIWPKDRLDLKPSLDAVMPEAQLETKVTNYLRKSEVLEDYWQRPITAEQLQAEIDRMASQTKQREVLHELFEALGNDPFLIAECLARPVLVEQRFAALESLSEPLEPWQNTEGQVIFLNSGGRYNPGSNSWTATSTVNAPSARELHTAVWTGSEMIVWGGGGNGLNTGGRYNPSTDSWTATSLTNAPAARTHHTAVWTGTEMIIWGGLPSGPPLNTGGRYNPTTDSWVATNTTNAPTARYHHTAVWSGSEMIIWGGVAQGASYLDTGGRYDPSSDSWIAISNTNVPHARYHHTAVWTGSEMIVWGGIWNDATDHYLNDGGRYSPSTDGWVATSLTGAPTARINHTAVWSGSEMIVWGGLAGVNGLSNNGGRYNPLTDAWIATSTTGAPDARYLHTAAWTGSQMIIWGGNPGVGGVFRNTGGRYNPSTNGWTPTSITNVPSARGNHAMVWSGSEMIVWGGAGAPPPQPTPTATFTATATPTSTATAAATATATAAATATATSSPTPTPSPTPCLPVLTQSTSQMITTGNSASCNDGNTHTDNSYWRAFDMAAFAGGGQYCINSLSFGVEFANTIQPVTVRLYTTSNFPAGFPGSLTQIGTTTLNVGSAQNGTVVTTPLVVMVPAGTPQLVMELFTPNGQPGGYRFFVGSNAALETGPSYFSAPACGITTPTTTAASGFPNMHIVFDVNGTCTCPTPTPCPIFNVTGAVGQCTTAGPSGVALQGVTITRTSSGGDASTVTNNSGNYFMSGFSCVANTLTPNKAARPPGSNGINTVDVVAVQRHFLVIGAPLTGCRLTAADCAAPAGITTGDVIAIQRYYLLFTTGIGTVGQYSFTPPSRSYSPPIGNQSGQNYDAIVFGDVISPFAVP